MLDDNDEAEACGEEVVEVEEVAAIVAQQPHVVAKSDDVVATQRAPAMKPVAETMSTYAGDGEASPPPPSFLLRDDCDMECKCASRRVSPYFARAQELALSSLTPPSTTTTS